MAQRTYKDIEAEANKRFGKGASREKFEFRRAQQEAAGLAKEAKKRGGVAGAYDRNKAIVQAAVPVLAGMLMPGIGSAAAGALTGGLARGLDRPGKGGIGLDLGQAARGAITGAGLGQLGGAVGSRFGISKIGMGGGTGGAAAPAPAAAPRAVQPSISSANMQMPSSLPSAGGAAGGAPAFTPSAAGQAASSRIAGMGSQMQNMLTGGQAGRQTLAGRALDFAKANPMVTSAALGGISDVMGQRSQQALEEQRLQQQQSQFQQQFDVSEEERKRRQAEANRLASLFMPRA
jgi:hypothetical protein